MKYGLQIGGVLVLVVVLGALTARLAAEDSKPSTSKRGQDGPQSVERSRPATHRSWPALAPGQRTGPLDPVAKPVDRDPGFGTSERAVAEPSTEVTLADVVAEEEALAVEPAPDGTRLRAVQPRELGYDSQAEMLGEVRDRLGLDANRPIRVVHDVRDGEHVVTVVVEPRS